MKLIVLLLAFVVCLLVLGGVSAVPSSPKCPPGYVKSAKPTRWAGWSFECVPCGGGNAFISADSSTEPLVTMYNPIVSGTRVGDDEGEPAKLNEYYQS